MARKKKIGQFSEDCLERQEVEEKKEIHCPLEGCLFTCTDKRGLNHHLSTCKQLNHIEYKKYIKELKARYKDSLDVESLGCGEKKCYQCSHKNCMRKEFELFTRIQKKSNTITKSIEKKQIQEQSQVLFDWFYNHVEATSPNPMYEMHKLLTFLKNGIDFITLVDALEFLVNQGQTNLQYLSKYTIEDAKKYTEYKKLAKISGTIPYFVQQYYKSFCKDISNYLLGKDVERLLAVKKSFKLTNEQIERIITYMVQRNIDSFNYIDRIVPKVLLLDKLQMRQMPKEEDYMQSVINELLTVKTNLEEVKNTYDISFTNDVIKKIKQLLLTNAFNQKFLAIEWLFLIKFPLDKESYEFAKNNAKIHKRMANFTGNQFSEYKSWFIRQKTLFEGH